MAVSDRVLALMRAKYEKLATQTCDIYRPVPIKDEYGSVDDLYVISASGVKCRLITRSFAAGANKEFSDKLMMEDVYQLTIPYGTVIDVNYQVWIGDDKYEVVVIRDKLTDTVYVEVEVRRMRD